VLRLTLVIGTRSIDQNTSTCRAFFG